MIVIAVKYEKGFTIQKADSWPFCWKQLNIRGKIERWLEDIWLSMLKFRDNIVATAMEVS